MIFIRQHIATLFIFVCAIALSYFAWQYSSAHHLVLIYNDAMSHLDLARLVIDDKQPGLTQIGGVWLPLNHLLALTLVWNNWAWHSGFAGSFFSMAAYVITVVTIFFSVKKITKSLFPSLAAALVYAINPNILYLQTTPLTEPLYLVSFVLSFYFFLCWVMDNNDTYLILLGFGSMLQTMIRYDGWFNVVVEALLIAFYLFVVRRRKISEVIAKELLYAYPVIFGCALWFLWNLFIFRDPLFFLLGHYSAHSQQFYLEHHSGLITKKNMGMSVLAYGYAMLDNAGNILMVFSVIGAGVFLFVRRWHIGMWKKLLLFAFLLAPIIFNIISLYEGFSTLNIPELHWNPSPSISGQWFNVRYGILVMPFCAVSVGVLAAVLRKRLLQVGISFLIVGVIVYQSVTMWHHGLITVTDGAIGSSSFANEDVAKALGKLVGKNQSVLLSTANYNAVAFRSGLDLSHFIHEGVSKEWNPALVSPEKYVHWIVMANGDIGEPAFNSLVKNEKNHFLIYYTKAYEGQHAVIYRLKTPSELAVRRSGIQLLVGDKPYIMKGVNDYDLAYQDSASIHTTFDELQKNGVNTVRFWLFGEGTPDGFQPQAGHINENRFATVDYILEQAKKHNIRVIPVLSNNWTDYGGKLQYLKWIGKSSADASLFYTSQQTQSLFENYINHVLSRQNTLTHTTYNQDPAILAWDIMNEPRIENNNTTALTNWTATISAYVKAHDSTHLVTIGTETIAPSTDVAQPFALCHIKTIDICSAHLYLYDKNTLLFSSVSTVQKDIEQDRKLATSLHKPAFIEEMGIPKSKKPFAQDPTRILQSLASSVKKANYNGLLLWNWSVKPDASFGFSENGFGTGNEYNSKQLQSILHT